MEFEADSGSDTMSCYMAMLDVVELIGEINGDRRLGQPRRTMGGFSWTATFLFGIARHRQVGVKFSRRSAR
eukprot:g18840.t1